MACAGPGVRRQTDLGPVDLVHGGASQLSYNFHDFEGLLLCAVPTVGEAAAVNVDRNRRLEADANVLNIGAAFSFRAHAEYLKMAQDLERGGVVDGAHVQAVPRN